MPERTRKRKAKEKSGVDAVWHRNYIYINIVLVLEIRSWSLPTGQGDRADVSHLCWKRAVTELFAREKGN
jgi:hypothetical protein